MKRGNRMKKLIVTGLLAASLSVSSGVSLEIVEATTQENQVALQKTSKCVRSIIGADQRFRIFNTQATPYNSVVWIAGASGTVVGKNTVLTAAHVVRSFYDRPSEITIIPGRNGENEPYGRFTAQSVYIPQEYLKKANSNFDYAVVTVAPNNGESIGNKVPMLPVALTNSIAEGTLLSTMGYPADKPRGTMWKSYGKVVSEMDSRIRYTMDTVGGQSGSPIINGNNEVVGVHTNGSLPSNPNPTNAGVKINTSVYQAIQAHLS
ncbi:hypothetical protein RV14_GL001216 [Enterococcus ratti]|uniref:Serine protease n=2 Tax=Enterococcus ratti TaxID=150033 RepID=A0A1L8WAP9_9ENTE|nr:hypothetical protein RV14_GL001216 [Enterococcus ratti]